MTEADGTVAALGRAERLSRALRPRRFLARAGGRRRHARPGRAARRRARSRPRPAPCTSTCSRPLDGARARCRYRTHRLHGAWTRLERRPTPTPLPTAGTGAWHDGNLDWTGAADGVQFRRAGRCARLRAYELWSRVTDGAARARSRRRGSPAIVPRAGWERRRGDRAREAARTPRRCKLAVVHHTAGTNRYTPAQAAAIVRGIEVYHVQGKRLERHRLQLSRRPLRHRLRGPRRRDRPNVIGAHARGLQHRHGRRRADRQLHRARRRRRRCRTRS